MMIFASGTSCGSVAGSRVPATKPSSLVGFEATFMTTVKNTLIVIAAAFFAIAAIQLSGTDNVTGDGGAWLIPGGLAAAVLSWLIPPP